MNVDWPRCVFWREVLLDHIELWRLGYERTRAQAGTR